MLAGSPPAMVPRSQKVRTSMRLHILSQAFSMGTDNSAISAAAKLISNSFQSMFLEHDATLAKQSTFRASRRRSRLGERCTWADVASLQAPHPSPPAWTLVPKTIRCYILATKVIAGRGGKGCRRGVPTHACTMHLRTSRSAHPSAQARPPRLHHPPRIACNRHLKQHWCAG